MAVNFQGGVGITGLGKYVPSRRVTNEELAQKLEIASDWIEERTGIRARHYAQENENATDFSEKASRLALQRAGIKAGDIDMVIGCTSSRDYIFPPLACKVQDLLGAGRAGAFDLTAGAAGFQIGISFAAARLKHDSACQHVVIIGTALLSRYLNWADFKSSILFGDGSGAAVLSRVPKNYGLLSFELMCDGKSYESFRLRGGGSSYPFSRSIKNISTHYIEMDGVSVGKQFLKHQPVVVHRALKKIGLTTNDVNTFIFHQANLRLIHVLLDRMGIARSKSFTNVEEVGNTADASLPIALCDAVERGRIGRDCIVVLAGAGAGGIFSAAVIRWY